MSNLPALTLSLRRIVPVLFSFLLFAAPTPSQSTSTLARVRAAGALSCGVDFEEAEYTNSDAHGNHSAFDLAICRAIAVAVLGPHATARVVPFRDEQDALEGLKAGKIDLLASASTNYLDTTSASLAFSRPIFYDFQGFLVQHSSGIRSSADLAGKKTCFLLGGEQEVQIQAYMQRQKIKWLPFPFSEEGEMEAALVSHTCDAITADVSQLAYERLAFRSMASSFDILPDIAAKDPLAIASNAGDKQWSQILDWVAESLIQAEESGITSTNITDKKRSEDVVVQRLLGAQHGYGQYLGLEDAWAANVIAAVGNYGELYDHTLGQISVMRLPRGLNNLWTNGGLMYALPIR